MKRIRIFDYLPALDAFQVTSEYREIAEDLGLVEWSPVVWIGRLFTMDNDFGEHWFDNWDAREERQVLAEQHGLDTNDLLIVVPSRFADGKDGPCNSPELRARFWRDVLRSLELSAELLFEKARAANERRKALLELVGEESGIEYFEDLDARIARWEQAFGD